MNIKYFLIFFITGSLIASHQEPSAPSVEVSYDVENLDGTVSYKPVDPDDNVHKEAIILYKQALEAAELDVNDATLVAITVDRSSDSIFVCVYYPNGSAGGQPLRLDGVDQV
jgi:hypothetical protein